MNKEKVIYPSMVIRSQSEAIELLEKQNKDLQQRIKTYENPEDLTLMFMYCDEKAKDKIKDLQKQLEEQVKYNLMVVSDDKGRDYYKNIIDKAIEYINKLKEYPYLERYYVGELLEILGGDVDDE